MVAPREPRRPWWSAVPFLAAALLAPAFPALIPAAASAEPRTPPSAPAPPGEEPGALRPPAEPAPRVLPRRDTADLLPLGTGLTFLGLGAAVFAIRMRQT